jgi:hypothetical protein
LNASLTEGTMSETDITRTADPVVANQLDEDDHLKREFVRDVLAAESGGRRVRVRSGSLHLEIEAAGAVLLVPDDEDETMRRFFRAY